MTGKHRAVYQRMKLDSPVIITNHVNGHVEEEILKQKEKRIGELEEEVRNLTSSLSKEKESRSDAEEEIATLRAQVASFQDAQ